MWVYFVFWLSEALWCVCFLSPHLHIFIIFCPTVLVHRSVLTAAMFEKVTYLREGEPTAGSLVVFIGALELKVLPPYPPQHSSQLFLQLQFPAKREKAGGEINKDRSTKNRGTISHKVHWVRKQGWADVFTTELGLELLEFCIVQFHFLYKGNKLIKIQQRWGDLLTHSFI